MQFLLVLGACAQGTDPDFGDDDGDTGDTGDAGAVDTDDTGDGGGDTGDDSAADSATDSGEDSGGDDTGTEDSGTEDSGTEDSGTTDTGSEDTGAEDTGTACTTADLDYIAEVRDAKGTAGTSFSAKEELTLAGVVKNPCSEDVTFETPSSCLVSSWTTTDSSGMGMGAAVPCLAVITTWTVAAGGSVEETMYWGRLSPDDWEASVSFDVKKHPTATQKFTVY